MILKKWHLSLIKFANKANSLFALRSFNTTKAAAERIWLKWSCMKQDFLHLSGSLAERTDVIVGRALQVRDVAL